MKKLWKNALHHREFWIDYFFLETDPEVWENEFVIDDEPFAYEYENPIRFPITKDSGLLLEMGEYLPSTSLKIYDRSAPTGIEIGKFDDSHPHAAVLRFEEVEALGNFLAQQVPEYPSAPYILLSNFMAITDADDLERIHQKTKEAWRSLALFSDDFIQDEVIDRIGYPIKGIQFTHQPEFGWYCEGEASFLSLRISDNKRFPFKMLKELLNHLGT
ncbi:hypothetical protein [Metabacillus sp. Hm71]|uniref:hypothetical protein n=1 Tax=Metabacillus sp. Hm71 TaxID=3450743 RepID=UPI003F41E865